MSLGKGTASKSSTGAAMSKYDVEVEARLKKLEAAVVSLQSHSHDTPSGGGDVAAVEAKLNDVITKLTKDSILY